MGRSRKKQIENLVDLQDKAQRLEALIIISKDIQEKERLTPISFNDFLYLASKSSYHIFRNIFQLFHDMVKYYVDEGRDDYPVTEDSVGFVEYNCLRLFQENCDDAFFADRLFANRFMNLVEGFKKGIQNNRIYLFEGPPGSGKSTFLNNLLFKLEEYTKNPHGAMYETLWRLDIEKLEDTLQEKDFQDIIEQNGVEKSEYSHTDSDKKNRYIDISCPNHDHPIIQIPKSFRKKFLDELIQDRRFKEKLFNSREYEWVLKDSPCSICSSIYKHLFDKVGDPLMVFNMINARKRHFNRQFGIGISVYSPGDERMVRPITNPTIQQSIKDLLKTDDIKYLYSDLANTNNGVLALMDIKENNILRLKGLHGIISDGVHKVDTLEEKITSLFIGLVNPEDKVHFENVKSFQDRVIYVNIPYVLDFRTEVSIYKDKFGHKLESWFLPRVLDNFAKIIIASRMNIESAAVKEWIMSPDKYNKYLDKNMLMLKMDIYTGKIPDWLSEEDIKGFTRPIRKKILDESESEGKKGFSGRQSLSLFNSFLIRFSKSEKLFTMDMVTSFFSEDAEFIQYIPEGFVEAVEDMYDFNVLQEVKEAIYYYNEEQISRDIQNYLTAINYEEGFSIKSDYTGDIIEVDEEYLKNIEAIFLGTTSTLKERQSFRRDVQTEYITDTLSQEIKVKGKNITKTKLFETLFHKYTKNLKENALAPYYDNENFRRAIMDYGNQSFVNYDERLKRDIELLISNLKKKFSYNTDGALQVSLYVIDRKLAKKYT
ncbi:MAG: serine protein kinase PrkA [Bacteroidota bacterium]